MTLAKVVLALFAGAIFAVPANAAPFTPQLNLAYELAVEYWGSEPTGCTSIDRQIVPDDSLDGAIGEATQPEPGASSIECSLYLARRLAAPRNFAQACAVEFHEVGHLEGLGHSPDPHSIMFSHLTFVPSECWRVLLRLSNHPHFQRPRTQGD